MNNSFLREPQVELFFQAYFVGLTVGHLPFFFGELGGITFVVKFVFSIPIVFILFLIHRIRYAAMNSRPYLWSSIILFAISALIATTFFLLSGSSIRDITLRDLTLLSLFLVISLPSVLVGCIYFIVMIGRKTGRQTGGYSS
ncbi:hypothetical protein [Rhizobium binae]|uniref:hypothetical protein n=1 Tax=Rhizobium binae TaxID=1138190 RepID=UPI001C83490C|nr:hypothetical protein [Rhizobium binae]MBX4960124.1 hypothetical protein [Rhizobium binae]